MIKDFKIIYLSFIKYSLLILLLLSAILFFYGSFIEGFKIWLTRSILNDSAINQLNTYGYKYKDLNLIYVSLLVYVLECFLLFFLKVKNIVKNLLLSSVMLWIFLNVTNVVPLGDHIPWVKSSYGSEAYLSELLASPLRHLVLIITNNIDYIGYIAPIFGFLSIYLYLSFGDNFVCGGSRLNSLFWSLSILSTPLPFLFSWYYIENPQLSIPFLLMYIGFMYAYINNHSESSMKFALLATVMLALASMVHGQNFFLAPSIPMILLCKELHHGSIAMFIKLLGRSLLIYFATICLVFILLKFLDFSIVPGNTNGGADHMMFVPLFAEDLGELNPHQMFSMAHFFEWSNIILHAAPLYFLVLILLPFYSIKINELFKESIFYQFLVILSTGYLAFIFLWNFDLGMPMDLDLMLSMSPPLFILVFVSLIKILENKKIFLIPSVFLAIALNLVFRSYISGV